MYNQKYEPNDTPMEIAIAIGVEPISTLCAASYIPDGVSEVDIVGGIRGEPIELIKCETVDLLVPVTAEIVIEGKITPYERKEEGPFGEFGGYQRPRREPKPVIHVKAVTHRNKPILTMSCPGVPIEDAGAMMFIISGTLFLEALRERGLPVTGVCLVPEAGGLLTVVSVKATTANVAKEIAQVIWSTAVRPTEGLAQSYIIVVEDDVDPFDIKEVLHALVSKCHPYSGIVTLNDAARTGFKPWGRAYFDCTWPSDLEPSQVPRRASFKDIYPLEVQQKALAILHKYGY